MNNLVKDKVPGAVLFGITAVSMGMLAFEISLVRLLSVMLSYHYVYGVTSLALLGSGIGAFAVQYREKKTDAEDEKALYRRLSLRLSLAAASMILTVLMILQIGRGSAGSIALYGLLLCIPFFFQGMFLSAVFRVFPRISGKLYFADLLGAALGCALVVLALNTFDDVESVLLFSGVVAISAVFLAICCRTGRSMTAAAGAALALPAVILVISAVFPALFQIPIGTNIDKEIYDSLNRFDGKIVETRWSAFGRTDLVEYDRIPEHMDIYLDGTAGTPMYAFNGNPKDPGVAALRAFPAYFPFQFFDAKQKDSALIIGPGGGRDVLIALLGGVRKITGIEVNPDLVNMVRDHSAFNGGLYTSLEQVELIVDEGRSFLRSHDTGKFDTILLTLPRTNTSRSREGYALTENYLFTTDSIKEYLDRLTDNGHLVVAANDDAEILRLLSLTLAVYAERGHAAETAMKSLYIFSASPTPVFVLRNGTFSEAEAEELYSAALKWEGGNPQASFFPWPNGSQMNPILYGVASGQVAPEDLAAMAKDLGYDIRPVSDNNPFFYKLESGLPLSIRMVLILSLLLLAAVGAALFATPGIKLSQRSGNRRLQQAEQGASKDGSGQPPVKGRSHKDVPAHGIAGIPLMERLRYLTVFTMLGIGYMIVEISLVQKFVFFLGKPVLSLTVILFAVLIGTGAGSVTTGRVRERHTGRVIFAASIIIVLLLLTYNFIVLPLLFRYLLGAALLWRTALSILILLPLSVFMGMPFPLMLRLLGEKGRGALIPWMWGINAAGSVAGSVSAMAIAILAGFNEAAVAGALCYLTAALASGRSKTVTK